MSIRAKAPAAQLDLIVETVIYLESESRRLAREASQRLGITATQLNVLKLLDEIGELSLSELSRRLAAQNSAVTGIVDRMVQAGLVVREQSAEDRRVWRIRMTPKGQEIGARTQVLPWDLLRSALASLDRREKEQLVAILEKVAAHVARQVGERAQARENAPLERGTSDPARRAEASEPGRRGVKNHGTR
jgi:DNA-binding MarR family transcriptional regulator